MLRIIGSLAMIQTGYLITTIQSITATPCCNISGILQINFSNGIFNYECLHKES
jgi:hypothetical protein